MLGNLITESGRKEDGPEEALATQGAIRVVSERQLIYEGSILYSIFNVQYLDAHGDTCNVLSKRSCIRLSFMKPRPSGSLK